MGPVAEVERPTPLQVVTHALKPVDPPPRILPSGVVRVGVATGRSRVGGGLSRGGLEEGDLGRPSCAASTRADAARDVLRGASRELVRFGGS